MLGHYLRGLLAAIVITVIAYALNMAGVLSLFLVILIGLAAFGGAFGVCHLIRRMTIYTLTGSRVLKKSGIINIRKEQARIEMITNIIIDRNLSQRMLGIGDLDIDTANDNTGSLIWWGLDSPYDVEAQIDRLRNADDDYGDEDQDDDFRY